MSDGNKELDELEQLMAEEAAEDADALARAKADAEQRGKDPFNLDRLETLYDTTPDLATEASRVPSREERWQTWEYKYYVRERDVMTIAEFAERQRALDPYR